MTEKNNTREKLYGIAKELIGNGQSFAEAEKQLREETDDAGLISEIINEVKKERNHRRTVNGFIKLGTGATFLVLGAFIPLFGLTYNHSFEEVMYGFTVIGAALLIWGLYELTS